MIELLAVMAIGGMLMSGVVTAIFQTSKVTVKVSPQIMALEDIKAVARCITPDMKIADNNTTLVQSNNMTLYWKTWYDASGNLLTSPAYHSVIYSLSGEKVKRNYDGTPTYVGKYISAITFSRSGSLMNLVTVTITSSPKGKAETAENLTYQFYLQRKLDLVQP